MGDGRVGAGTFREGGAGRAGLKRGDRGCLDTC